MKEAVLVDLDGTTFNTTKRDHFVKFPDGARRKSRDIDWPAYNAACVDDTPIDATIQLIDILARAGYLIFFVSGRAESAREETERQIANLDIYAEALVMRKDDDRTPNGAFKVRAVRELEAQFNCKFVLAIDDYASARDALEEIGIPTILVKENARG